MLAPIDASASARAFDVHEYLALDQEKDLLRFTTAGSVDDGKSTLIGRLLYDSQNVYEDQIRSIAKSTINRSAGKIDLSLLTDGLRAEREQGITIDVAYRYFTTARRKFIIADTPGHEQYTRNMATGASTADLAIILIDARNGVQNQSRRHAYIASLLAIPKFVIAVNKMDLVGFDQAVFASIREEFSGVLAKLGVKDAYFVPISALTGDNVVNRGEAMPWFEGANLLEHLETVQVSDVRAADAFRLPVQRVIRPDQFFRGYAGQIASGSIRPGDMVMALPAGKQTRVKSIESFDGPLERAFAPMSVTLTLEDELDISRGDLLTAISDRPSAALAFDAKVVWMNEQPLDPERGYLLKHASQTVAARVGPVAYSVDMGTLDERAGARLEMNGIGLARIETGRPLYFDPYRKNRITGSAILIDAATNATVGAVMIENEAAAKHETGPVTSADRVSRFGHPGSIVRIGDRARVAEIVERQLFARGALPVILNSCDESAARVIESAGALALIVSDSKPAISLPEDDEEAAHQLIKWLERQKILRAARGLHDGEGI
ncbi:MAG: sulfate adenylyltransferase subunit CysN [Bryobacteraceae bacterium]